ncbi:MAG TPA: hypothetical protein PKN87_05865 [Syntrophomonadaceae bacterium]|nr:hypothetical protein [Syntrophomonadaceae bacterium]HPR93930.1 hypothetical protein [Syntrophomonadaceae bacterium]
MYILNEEKMFYDESEGQTIIINIATGVYYSFDKMSSAVIKDLIAGAEPELIVKGLQELKDCPDNIEGKLGRFINKLNDLEIIVAAEGKSEATQPSYDQEIAGDGYEFAVDAFEEIADLLLMDPIHEVSGDMGWPVKKRAD